MSFETPEFTRTNSEMLYYLCAIQESSLANNVHRFDCELNIESRCIKANFNGEGDNHCLNPAEEVAWSAPIFIDVDAMNASVVR